STALARCPVEETSRSYQSFEQAGTLLFVLDDCTDKPANYVYGTVHSDSQAVAQVAEPAFAAARMSSRVGFEYLTPSNAAQIIAQAMYVPQGQPPIIPTVLNEEEYKILKQALVHERKMDEDVVARMQPWAAAVLM